MLAIVVTIVVAIVVLFLCVEVTFESLVHKFTLGDLRRRKSSGGGWYANDDNGRTYVDDVERLAIDAAFLQAFLATDVNSIGDLVV